MRHAHPAPHVERRAGVLWVLGSRVRVARLWSLWSCGAGSLSAEALWRRYPQLRRAAVLSALSFAADHQAELEAEPAVSSQQTSLLA